MKSHFSTNHLTKIKTALPVNGMETVAERMGVSLSTISRVLNGVQAKNQKEVVKTALEVIEEEKTEQQLLAEKINAL